MQARLTLTRFPSFLFAIVFAVLAAIILGGVLGYTLKPAVVTPGRTQVIVLHDPGTLTSTDNPCVFVNHHKSC